MDALLAAIVVLCVSGIPACFLSARSAAGQRVTTLLVVIGSALGLFGVAASLRGTGAAPEQIPLALPWGHFAVAIDALSAVFLVPVFVIPALGSIYGLGYWKHSRHPESGRRLGVFYGLLAGAMALVAVARDGVLFLIAWEVMAIAAYFCATAADGNAEVRRAGWVYLVATHAGTLCLIAMFALWRSATGSFALEAAAAMPAGTLGAIFVLALIGFGFKAGLMPLHVWLPGAHANAPSHVSAVMSGVMIKMGVYGIVRVAALLPAAPAWSGVVLLVAGAVTGIAGIAFAIGQHDLKRLLAYSSIENIGVIALGIGLAMLGRLHERADWVVLGLGGALLHVWNHGLFKSLLFLNAGAVIHATHTRDINRLGGLAKRMPRVAALFVAGALAICALPPLNGFVSEWMLYLGLLRTLGLDGAPGYPVAAMAAVALAAIGALAVACFVKALGVVFLGSPRTPVTRHAHDPSANMLAPMTALAAACAGIGLFPATATPLLEDAARAWGRLPASAPSLSALAPLSWITAPGVGLVVLVAIISLASRALPRARSAGAAPTWDCGYARPTARMQYTGSSFAGTITGLFAFILRPHQQRPRLRGLFPAGAAFASVIPDTVLDRLVLPVFHAAGRHAPRLRVLQQGQTQMYVLYILIITIVLLIRGAMGVQR